MEQLDVTFGDQLRRLRLARGLSLREFQRLTHHSKSVVWDWEQGRKVPSRDIAARLDHLLEASGQLLQAAVPAAPVPDTSHLDSEIVRRYSHQDPVSQEIRRRASGAEELDVLAVRGLGILGLNDSLLRPALLTRTQTLRARVLLLDPDCDAAAKRAGEIGESTASFAAGIKLAVARLEEVVAAATNVQLEVGFYTGLPVWRIIRLDDLQWVSSFGATWEGHESAVSEIAYTPRGSLWAGYRRQFKDLYDNARRVI